jgi:peptidoglycan/LPS O-acetylase OafA/YrhL
MSSASSINSPNPDYRRAEFFGSLEGMRGFAALGVVLYHVFWMSHIWANPLIRHGALFVDFFFVISGFVICHIYSARLGGPDDLRNFLLLRTARLYPLHLFTLLLISAMMLGFEWLGSNWDSLAPLAGDPRLLGSQKGFVRNLLLLQGISFQHGFSFNRPSWSISTEYYTYLVFAVIILATAARRFLIIAIALAIIAAAGTHLWQRGGLEVAAVWDRLPLSAGFLRCLTGFFIGVVLQFIWRVLHTGGRNVLGNGWRSHLMEIASIGFVAGAMWFCGEHRGQFIVLLAFAFAVLVFTMSNGWFTLLLTSVPAQKLGQWSYSIYLMHFIVLIACFDVLRLVFHQDNLAHLLPRWEFYLVTALFVGLVLLVSGVTYRFIEVPPRTWAKDWIARRRLTASAPAA